MNERGGYRCCIEGCKSASSEKRGVKETLFRFPKDVGSFKTTHSTNTRMIMLGDDGIRSQYVPPKPTVKILKRPTRDSQGSGDGPLVNGDKPKQPIKSLKQREQEYAEARKRILGEEKSPEEKLLHEINRIQPKSITSSSSNLPSNVLRMPLGPDGTRGFNVRR
nr:PREDICTED: SUZ domain-containing protein 1 isoform X2 [Megachile rotundata]